MIRAAEGKKGRRIKGDWKEWKEKNIEDEDRDSSKRRIRSG